MSDPCEDEARVARARIALEGLSLGDAFGERFFGPAALARQRIEHVCGFPACGFAPRLKHPREDSP